MIAIPSFVPSCAAQCNNHIYLLCSPCMCQKHNIDIRMHVTPSLGASPRKPEEGFCVRQAPHPFYAMFHISLFVVNDQYYICSTFFLSRCQSVPIVPDAFNTHGELVSPQEELVDQQLLQQIRQNLNLFI